MEPLVWGKKQNPNDSETVPVGVRALLLRTLAQRGERQGLEEGPRRRGRRACLRGWENEKELAMRGDWENRALVEVLGIFRAPAWGEDRASSRWLKVREAGKHRGNFRHRASSLQGSGVVGVRALQPICICQCCDLGNFLLPLEVGSPVAKASFILTYLAKDDSYGV